MLAWQWNAVNADGNVLQGTSDDIKGYGGESEAAGEAFGALSHFDSGVSSGKLRNNLTGRKAIWNFYRCPNTLPAG